MRPFRCPSALVALLGALLLENADRDGDLDLLATRGNRESGKADLCRRTVVAVAVAVVSLGAHSCSGSTPSSPSAAAEQPTIRVTTAHFRLLADRVDAARLAAVADALDTRTGSSSTRTRSIT